MKLKHIALKTAQWIVCIISWGIVPPLYLYVTRRWDLIRGKARMTFLFLSPIFILGTLMVYMLLALIGKFAYDLYQRTHRFADNEKIERITETEFPEFDVVECEPGLGSFTGDYTDRLIFEFDEIPSEEYYQMLDSLIATQKTDWYRNENEYVWSRMWGNGFPAPNGEDDDEDMSLTIRFAKGSKNGEIRYGAW